MKKLPIKLLLVCSLIALGGIFLFHTGCETASDESDPPRTCTIDSDCYDSEYCSDEGICTYCKCRDMGGDCTLLDVTCPDGTFDWSNLGCPGGREEKCCLPSASCTAVGGTCEHWESTCPDGTGAYGPMDCPNGRYDQCCIPIR